MWSKISKFADILKCILGEIYLFEIWSQQYNIRWFKSLLSFLKEIWVLQALKNNERFNGYCEHKYQNVYNIVCFSGWTKFVDNMKLLMVD